MRFVMLARNPQSVLARTTVEAARARGHEHRRDQHAARAHEHHLAASRRCRYGGRMLPQYDAVIPRIGASITHYGLAVLRQFEVQGVFPLNESVAIGRSRDKLRALAAAGARGHRPAGHRLRARPAPRRGRDQGGRRHAGASSSCSRARRACGVILAETAASAKSIIEAFSAANMNILVQEFIKEAGGTDIRALVVGGEVVASMKRSGKMGEFRANLHRGGKAEAVVLTDDERRTAVALGRGAGPQRRRRRHAALQPRPARDGGQLLARARGHRAGATGIDIASRIVDFLEQNASYGKTQTKGVG